MVTVVQRVVLGKFQAACISKITVELTTFLPCTLMNEMKSTESVAVVLRPVTVKHRRLHKPFH